MTAGTLTVDPPVAGPVTAEPRLADRGRTTVGNRVLERIAVQALTEVDLAGGAARRLLGMPLGRDTAGAAPRVEAHVDGQVATMRMTISVVYPTPVRRLTRQLRELVTARVGELTGLRLCQLDIDIARLIRGRAASPAGPVTTLDRSPAPAMERPTAGRPEGATRPGTDTARAARRAFRPLRSVPAVLVAALLAGAALLAAAEVISRLVDRPLGLLPVDRLIELGRDTRWSDPLALTGAGLLAGLGLLLLMLAVWPGARRAVPVALGEPGVVAGITRGGLRRVAGEAALSIDGISRADVTVRRRELRVDLTSPLHDNRGLADQVAEAVAARVDQLAPLTPLRIRVAFRRAPEPEAPEPDPSELDPPERDFPELDEPELDTPERDR